MNFKRLCAKSFDDSAKDCYFNRFHNGSKNMFIPRKIGFFIFYDNVIKTCSHGLENSKNIEIKYLLNFKAYFCVLDTFPKVAFVP